MISHNERIGLANRLNPAHNLSMWHGVDIFKGLGLGNGWKQKEEYDRGHLWPKSLNVLVFGHSQKAKSLLVFVSCRHP